MLFLSRSYLHTGKNIVTVIKNFPDHFNLNMQEMKVDILERANQMVSLCRNAATTANQTVITLADQREQLEDIETGLISIDATLIDTKHNINRLKGITQRVIGTFRTKFHKKIVSKLMIHSTKKQSSTPSPARRVCQIKFIL